jgi:hypothetical protein
MNSEKYDGPNKLSFEDWLQFREEQGVTGSWANAPKRVEEEKPPNKANDYEPDPMAFFRWQILTGGFA